MTERLKTVLSTGPGQAEPTMPVESTARTLAGDLLAVSREILLQSAKPEIPTLGQLILKRGMLLSELGGLTLNDLPPDVRQAVLDTLTQCRKMDETIEGNMAHMQDELGDQLKVLRESRTLMDTYRAAPRDDTGHHSKEA